MPPKDKMLSEFRDAPGALPEVPFPSSGPKTLVIDMSYVTMLESSTKPATFRQFYDNIWSKILTIGYGYDRIDIVTDDYKRENHLKEHCRRNRGSGTCLEFDDFTPFPPRFRENFMQNSSNKAALYDRLISFLHDKSCSIDDEIDQYVTFIMCPNYQKCSCDCQHVNISLCPTACKSDCQHERDDYDNRANIFKDKIFVFTKDQKVISNKEDVKMSNCSHIEADTRIIIHIIDALQTGSLTVTIRTSDSDVIVLLISFIPFFVQLCYPKSPEIFVLSGTSGTVTKRAKDSTTGLYHHAINPVAAWITEEKCKGMMLLFSFTGCDYVEAFHQHGKVTWLKLYLEDASIHEVFASMITSSDDIQESEIDAVSQFVLKKYKARGGNDLTAGRLDIIQHTAPSSMRLLPPSRSALIQHLRRSVYVARWIWGRAFLAQPQYPNPVNWGWSKASPTSKLTTVWTTLTGDYKTLTAAVMKRCTCSSKCQRTGKVKCNKCSCTRDNMNCYGRCGCRGDCCGCPDCS